MPKTKVFIYQEKAGKVPLLEWLDGLSSKIRYKCIAAVELLSEKGNELRRPYCDYLEQGIYELRVRRGNVHYRILYAFVGENIVLLSHGCIKERGNRSRENRIFVTASEAKQSNIVERLRLLRPKGLAMII